MEDREKQIFGSDYKRFRELFVQLNYASHQWVHRESGRHARFVGIVYDRDYPFLFAIQKDDFGNEYVRQLSFDLGEIGGMTPAVVKVP